MLKVHGRTSHPGRPPCHLRFRASGHVVELPPLPQVVEMVGLGVGRLVGLARSGLE